MNEKKKRDSIRENLEVSPPPAVPHVSPSLDWTVLYGDSWKDCFQLLIFHLCLQTPAGAAEEDSCPRGEQLCPHHWPQRFGEDHGEPGGWGWGRGDGDVALGLE